MKDNRIESVLVVHENLYTASIEGKDVLRFQEDDDILLLSVKKDYRYEESGTPRWRSIEPLDKDEITRLQVTCQNDEVQTIDVPFHDVSTNGALCSNEKSESFECENSLTIKWKKRN